jgi:hypothetical protein
MIFTTYSNFNPNNTIHYRKHRGLIVKKSETGSAEEEGVL